MAIRKESLRDCISHLTVHVLSSATRSVLCVSSGVPGIWIFLEAGFGKCFRILGVALVFTRDLWTLFFEPLPSGKNLGRSHSAEKHVHIVLAIGGLQEPEHSRQR